MKSQFTNSAQNEFDAAVIYIAARNPFAVRPFIDRVEKARRQIEEFPESGAPIPEFPQTEYRQVFARPYRIFYRVHEGTVIIAAFYHDRQIPQSLDK